MIMKLLVGGTCIAALALPLAAQAQGVPGGAVHGFHEGNRIAGPVGAVVGTSVVSSEVLKECLELTRATTPNIQSSPTR